MPSSSLYSHTLHTQSLNQVIIIKTFLFHSSPSSPLSSSPFVIYLVLIYFNALILSLNYPTNVNSVNTINVNRKAEKTTTKETMTKKTKRSNLTGKKYTQIIIIMMNREKRRIGTKRTRKSTHTHALARSRVFSLILLLLFDI